jgi:hypothetical protein
VSAPNVIRLCGTSLVVGGLFSLTANVLFYLFLRLNEGAVSWLVMPLLTLAGILVAFLFASGLVGLHVLAGQSGLGIAGLVLAYLAFLATLLPWIFAVVYVGYQILFVADGTITNPIVVFPEVAVDLAGDALLAAGLLALGLASLGVGALGRWAFVPFVLAFLYLLSTVFWATHHLGWEVYGWPPLYPAMARGPLWILLGGVLWWRAPNAETNADAATAALGDPA